MIVISHIACDLDCDDNAYVFRYFVDWFKIIDLPGSYELSVHRFNLGSPKSYSSMNIRSNNHIVDIVAVEDLIWLTFEDTALFDISNEFKYSLFDPDSIAKIKVEIINHLKNNNDY